MSPTGYIELDQLEDRLASVFEYAAGFKGAWVGREKKAACLPQGKFSRGPIRMVGFDEEFLEDNPANPVPPGEDLIRVRRGTREFVWTIEVESSGNAPGKASHDLLETFRGRLWTERAQVLLGAAGVGIVVTGAVNPIGIRGRSRATLDVTLHGAVETRDCPTTYIETVELETEIRDEAGDLLPDELQVIP